MKTFIISCVCCLVMVAPASAVNISWLSYHPTDDPTTQATAQGYTMASDHGYVQLLRDAGHTVNRFQVQSPNAAFIDQIDDADLVIASRQVNSGDFLEAAELASWHGLSKPMMLMSGYILRGGTGDGARLGFMEGNSIADTAAGGPVTLTATAPSHPIFQGITLDASNNMTFATYPISTPNGAAMRGISVVNGAVAGGGTVLATVGTAGDSNAGRMLISQWETGAAIGGNSLAAPRMAFLSGTREPSSPADIQLAGVHDLTPEGNQLFLNAVCHMVPGGCGPPLVFGDTDGDGIGGEFPDDFNPIRANFRKSVTSRQMGDLVPNGVVDFDDFRQWKAAHLGGGGSLEGLDLSFAANVPEPGTATLLLLALSALSTRRVRN